MQDFRSLEQRWPGLSRARKAIVVVDVVESVRLMQRDELGFISCWQRFVDQLQARWLAPGARLVKSLGDGLLIEADDALTAARIALAAGPLLDELQQDGTGEAIQLRCGVHIGDVTIHQLDVFGVEVNLAARLMSLAQPGQVVVSVEMRDLVNACADFEIDDLGDCFVKHLNHPVRAFVLRDGRRAAPPGRSEAMPPAATTKELLPTVAVIPFDAGADVAGRALGDALADDIIAALSADTRLRVLSRLTTSSLRDCQGDLQPLLKRRLHVGYALSGRVYRLGDDCARVVAELMDVAAGTVVWADAAVIDERALFAGQDRLVPQAVRAICEAVQVRELQRLKQLPLPNLDGFTLYSGGTTLLHRLAQRDFVQARELLDHLNERFPRSAPPLAMLAKWHVLRVLQGWTPDRRLDGLAARQAARRAIDCDQTDALSLALYGLSALLVDGDLESAEQRYRRALEVNPQEPYAWALLSSLHCYRDRPDEAIAAADRALVLSPLDPALFLFETHRALARLCAMRIEEGISAARRALAANGNHTATHRLLIIGLVLAGRVDEAREAAQVHNALEPQFSMARYRERYPGRQASHAERHALALEAAGLPP